jgi:DegV family protein with EDD domain
VPTADGGTETSRAVAVVTDSAADLPAEIARQHGVTVVPLDVRLGPYGPEVTRSFDAAEFWRRCATVPELPETSAPSPGAFHDAFLAAGASGARGVVCVTLSSALSATYQAAVAAAAEVAATVEVEVIDSRFVTLGQGLLVVEAAERAARGESLASCVAGVRDAIGRTEVFGTLDTLENLRRGGRIGAAQALLGSLLSVKPIVEVRNGVVEPESRQRTRSRSLAYLVDKLSRGGPIERLAVVHAAAPEIDQLLSAIETMHPPEQTIVALIGPVIGAHTGFGTIGLCVQRCSGERGGGRESAATSAPAAVPSPVSPRSG